MLRRRLARIACYAVCFALTFAATPAVTPAAAAGSGTVDQRMQAKKAEAARIETKLAALREQLSTQLADYDLVTAELEAVRQDVASTATRLEALGAEIAAGEARLAGRVVAMYKTGGMYEIEMLLSTGSFREFLEGMDYLTIIQDSEMRFVDDLGAKRAENEALRIEQERRESELTTLRQESEARATQIELSMTEQETLRGGLWRRRLDAPHAVRAQQPGLRLGLPGRRLDERRGHPGLARLTARGAQDVRRARPHGRAEDRGADDRGGGGGVDGEPQGDPRDPAEGAVPHRTCEPQPVRARLGYGVREDGLAHDILVPGLREPDLGRSESTQPQSRRLAQRDLALDRQDGGVSGERVDLLAVSLHTPLPRERVLLAPLLAVLRGSAQVVAGGGSPS
jgi:peptidoglycan hydrolase CwlO-like protein